MYSEVLLLLEGPAMEGKNENQKQAKQNNEPAKVGFTFSTVLIVFDEGERNQN